MKLKQLNLITQIILKIKTDCFTNKITVKNDNNIITDSIYQNSLHKIKKVLI